MGAAEWATVAGVVVRGHGVASGQGSSPYPQGTISMQAPFFRVRGLDLAPFVPATINVSIAPATFRIVRPAHLLRQVVWTELHQPEDFSFVRCRLSAGGRGPSGCYSGLVYYPHPETKERHHQDAAVLELLMPPIAGLAYGDAVTLALPVAEIEIRS
jgi:hypothetical protein